MKFLATAALLALLCSTVASSPILGGVLKRVFEFLSIDNAVAERVSCYSDVIHDVLEQHGLIDKWADLQQNLDGVDQEFRTDDDTYLTVPVFSAEEAKKAHDIFNEFLDDLKQDQPEIVQKINQSIKDLCQSYAR